MSYDNPITEVYYLPSAGYGGATGSKTIKGPKGKSGLVRDIIVLLSVDAVGTTTVPEVTVGSAAGLVEYARFRLGTTAILGYLAAATPFRAKALIESGPFTGGIAPVLNDYAGHIALETARLPADTAVVISGKAGVGGTPAGTFEAYVRIDWF